jgi:Protein of unknown function (DUF3108)
MKLNLKLNFMRPCLGAVLLASLVLSSNAGAEALVSRYTVNVGGIPAGEGLLRTSFDAKHYHIELSADVGTIFDSTKIRGASSGAKAGRKLTPERFQLTFSGGEHGVIDVHFKGDGGSDETINTRMRGVFDPLSAMLVASLRPHSQSSNPCNHVLPIFTGKARFDLKLRSKRKIKAQHSAVFVVCDVDYAPVPGQAFQRIKFEIVFQKISKPKFWLVERISMPTTKGEVIIERADTSVRG